MNATDHIETRILNELMANEPYFEESELDTLCVLVARAQVDGWECNQVEREILWDLMVGQ